MRFVQNRGSLDTSKLLSGGNRHVVTHTRFSEMETSTDPSGNSILCASMAGSARSPDGKAAWSKRLR